MARTKTWERAIIEDQKTRVVVPARPTPKGELRLVPFKFLANPFLSVNKQSRAVASYFYPYKGDGFSVSGKRNLVPHTEEHAPDPDGENDLKIDFDHEDSDRYSTDSWLDGFMHEDRYELHEWRWETRQYTDADEDARAKEPVAHPAWWWTEPQRKLQEMMGGEYDEQDEYMRQYMGEYMDMYFNKTCPTLRWIPFSPLALG
ncbi:hypothetical protein DL765_000879 [Monosporascus sp. GIB2]|nr:hypothetical protein DL765_000879 [Monosporascus sp. GIB2]